MTEQEIDDLRGFEWMQSRIPALDALVHFLPDGPRDAKVDAFGTSHRSRWYLVEGGTRVVVSMDGEPDYDPSQWVIEKGAWDHEHCDLCSEKQGGYNQLAIVDPEDSNILYLGGSLNLIHSSDGGSSYSIISDWAQEGQVPYVHADFHCRIFDKKKRLWIGNDGGLAVSSDHGTTWSTTENRGLSTHLIIQSARV